MSYCVPSTHSTRLRQAQLGSSGQAWLRIGMRIAYNVAPSAALSASLPATAKRPLPYGRGSVVVFMKFKLAKSPWYFRAALFRPGRINSTFSGLAILGNLGTQNHREVQQLFCRKPWPPLSHRENSRGSIFCCCNVSGRPIFFVFCSSVRLCILRFCVRAFSGSGSFE